MKDSPLFGGMLSARVASYSAFGSLRFLTACGLLAPLDLPSLIRFVSHPRSTTNPCKPADGTKGANGHATFAGERCGIGVRLFLVLLPLAAAYYLAYFLND